METIEVVTAYTAEDVLRAAESWQRVAEQVLTRMAGVTVTVDVTFHRCDNSRDDLVEAARARGYEAGHSQGLAWLNSPKNGRTGDVTVFFDHVDRPAAAQSPEGVDDDYDF